MVRFMHAGLNLVLSMHVSAGLAYALLFAIVVLGVVPALTLLGYLLWIDVRAVLAGVALAVVFGGVAIAFPSLAGVALLAAPAGFVAGVAAVVHRTPAQDLYGLRGRWWTRGLGAVAVVTIVFGLAGGITYWLSAGPWFLVSRLPDKFFDVLANGPIQVAIGAYVVARLWQARSSGDGDVADPAVRGAASVERK